MINISLEFIAELQFPFAVVYNSPTHTHALRKIASLLFGAYCGQGVRAREEALKMFLCCAAAAAVAAREKRPLGKWNAKRFSFRACVNK